MITIFAVAKSAGHRSNSVEQGRTKLDLVGQKSDEVLLNTIILETH